MTAHGHEDHDNRSHDGYGHGGHDHSGGHAGHSHALSADANKRWLGIALALIAGFMAVEVIVGLIAGSLALLSDAAHMLTDAAAIVLALTAIRLAARPAKGSYTYGLKRAEILSAQANGLTLVLLGAWLAYEAIHRLIDPPQVDGKLVVLTGLAGIGINIAAAWAMSKANRSSSMSRAPSSTSSTTCSRSSPPPPPAPSCGPPASPRLTPSPHSSSWR